MNEWITIEANLQELAKIEKKEKCKMRDCQKKHIEAATLRQPPFLLETMDLSFIVHSSSGLSNQYGACMPV